MLDKSAWCVHIANVGPGLAYVDGIWYSLQVHSAMGDGEIIDGSLQDVISLLGRCRLRGNLDFHLEHITPGTPLGIVKQPTEGFEFAAFAPEALIFIKYLAFSIRVVDTMGDRYVKALPFLATLPEHVVQREALYPTLELISPSEMLSEE
ncbi:MAG TPA: hypothetical protein VF647_17850 [Longimicrobium sp.]